MKLTTKEINEIVKSDKYIQEWGLYDIYNDKLVNGRRKLKYMRNGWQVPEKLKSNILKSLTKSFKDVENIESIEWKRGECFRGEYDYVRIIKVD